VKDGVNKRSYWPQGKHENKWSKDVLCAKYKCSFVGRRIEGLETKHKETNSKCSSRIDLVVSREIGA